MKTDPIEYIQPVIEFYIIMLSVILLIPVIINKRIARLYRKVKRSR